ncbi:MAG: TfoX/Sxy family protein [Lewinellaceae bacterium]|nr:TfoX/Sxy family protein [Saprospiraceae bacterium]MCB9313263.1 TfoX/Sxy family protein [Lewinellaceae bacterium]HRW75862.1 TfoX/Sxy family protein [Saprospiraceae bacterium]
MAYSEYFADRIRQTLDRRSVPFEEKKMMGGLCFLVDDKMCVGIVKDELMVRLHPDEDEENLKLPGARPMDFTGRPMKGYLLIDNEGTETDRQLETWIDKALAFNPLAKSSKKKKS